jgi:hypothetical protein
VTCAIFATPALRKSFTYQPLRRSSRQKHAADAPGAAAPQPLQRLERNRMEYIEKGAEPGSVRIVRREILEVSAPIHRRPELVTTQDSSPLEWEGIASRRYIPMPSNRHKVRDRRDTDTCCHQKPRI